MPKIHIIKIKIRDEHKDKYKTSSTFATIEKDSYVNMPIDCKSLDDMEVLKLFVREYIEVQQDLQPKLLPINSIYSDFEIIERRTEFKNGAVKMYEPYTL